MRRVWRGSQGSWQWCRAAAGLEGSAFGMGVGSAEVDRTFVVSKGVGPVEVWWVERFACIAEPAQGMHTKGLYGTAQPPDVLRIWVFG